MFFTGSRYEKVPTAAIDVIVPNGTTAAQGSGPSRADR